MVKSKCDNFLVGIRCYTYNQSQYITDTLNGFAKQQTTFPYIAMVVDDASTDGEQDIIVAYLEEHFELSDEKVAYKKETDYAYITFARHKTNINCYIAVLYLKENIHSKGLSYKKVEYISEWRDHTKYEAICEGDDYWTDPLKLQKQVEFLENNHEYGMCYTQCQYFYQDKNLLAPKPWGGPYESFEQIMKDNPIPTLTVLLRLDLQKKYTNEIEPSTKDWLMGDYPSWIWFSHESKIKFLPYCTGVYRVLSDSASHSSDVEKLIRFSASSIEIRRFYEQLFNIPRDTYVEPNFLLRRKLYLYARYHRCFDFIKTISSHPKLMLNLRVIGYIRFFFRRTFQ